MYLYLDVHQFIGHCLIPIDLWFNSCGEGAKKQEETNKIKFLCFPFDPDKMFIVICCVNQETIKNLYCINFLVPKLLYLQHYVWLRLWKNGIIDRQLSADSKTRNHQINLRFVHKIQYLFFFKYGWEPVLIQYKLIDFDAILEMWVFTLIIRLDFKFLVHIPLTN